MEIRAPFVIVGAFVLAAILAVFGFVFWLHNASGLGARTVYRVQFNSPVPGLLVGAGVLFNGIRVGEVTELSLSKENPTQVNAAIAVNADTPVRADTKVGVDFQGLTGVPVIALEGGSRLPNGPMPVLVAEPGAGESMTQAARNALSKVDAVLSDNAGPLKDTIANFKVFSEGLARNTGRLDGIIAGVERMTGADKPQVTKVVYDLKPADSFPSPRPPLRGALAIPEPTAVVMFDTQRLLTAPAPDDPAFAGFQWSDSLPKLVQAKLIQSFENYDIDHAPLRGGDVGADRQLLIDLRAFQLDKTGEPAAEIAFSAKLVDKDGRVIAARLFRETRKTGGPDAADVLAAFNEAFAAAARALIAWTVAQG